MGIPDKIEWIAVDWGTSNLRAWPIGPDEEPVAALASDKGMGSLTPNAFEPALIELVGDWLSDAPIPVVCCGMVGAAQGWKEAPYAAVPCTPPGLAQSVKVATKNARLKVHILPGVKQIKPADVMRGEETQIAGFLAKNPDFDGVICLPGTHTKWVQVQGGVIERFRTFMTGELFALLAKNSILRYSLGDGGWDVAAFEAGIAEGIQSPENLSAMLFSIRAGTLVHDTSPETSRARLSGVLLGLEIKAAHAFWHNRHIVMIGSQQLSGHYAQALGAQGADVSITDGSELTLAGLKLAYQSLKEPTP